MKTAQSLVRTSLLALGVLTIAAGQTGCIVDDESWDDSWDEEIGETSLALTYNGRDYLFVNSPTPRNEARTRCQLEGYDLASIGDAAEQSWLNARLNQQGGGDWWIGYNDIGVEGTWVWSDGTQSPYTNWAPGEPNNHWGNEDCAVINYDGQGRWNDLPCDWAVRFICEKSSPPITNDGSFAFSASNTNSAQQNTHDHAVYLPQGALFTVGTCGVPGASTATDTYLRVNNPSGQEIASNDDADFGACGYASNLSFVAPVAGTYVVRAGCYGGAACSGTVAFTR